MTGNPEITGLSRVMNVTFKNPGAAPMYTPNVGRASTAGGTLYIDLGFVDPFEALEVGIKHGTSPSIARISATPMLRLAVSSAMAEQLVYLISTQLELTRQQAAANEAIHEEK